MPDANDFTQAFTSDFKSFFEKAGSSTQVLLATPQSEFHRELVEMTRPAGDDQARKAALGRIEVSMEILRAAANDGPKITIRHFDTQFRVPMVVIDDTYCYLAVVLPPDDEAHSLRLELEGSDSYTRSCVTHFDRIGTLGKPAVPSARPKAQAAEP